MTRPPSNVKPRPPAHCGPFGWTTCTRGCCTHPPTRTSGTPTRTSGTHTTLQALRTTPGTTPAAAPAGRTHCTKPRRRRASSPPSAACFARRKRAGLSIPARRR